jgi:8-amino-7-oxononanoate synthase
MYALYNEHLSRLQDTCKYRKLPELPFGRGALYLDFSTNDYLGLSKKQELLDAAIDAGKIYGVGSTGSRLLSGNHKIFELLESRIAKDKGLEAALVFNSGFQANITVLSSLLDQKILKKQPLVFFDKLNHSSLYQAVFLSGAELVRYHHNDIEHLKALLNKYINDKRPKFIVTETIFGMDGDIAHIRDIVALADKSKAFLYLDEAHATGLIGPKGYGMSPTLDLTDIPHIIMGTFSKALGCSGGYIACSQILKDYLINKAPGFIYSKSNSPMVIGASYKAWSMIKDLDFERKQLFASATILRTKLRNLGFNIGSSSTHIVPIIFGTEELALKAKELLFQNNILVSYIRPPTVPVGTSRIRIALNSTHTERDLDQLIQILETI